MLLEKQIKKLFQQLIEEDAVPVHCEVNGFDILIHSVDHSKISLSTQVYNGGNFIPQSVRRSLSKKAPFFTYGHIKTHLKIDEERFQIFLHYLDHITYHDNFKLLLEEFTWLAEQWRLYLDEHDKHDLVHVRVK